MQKYWCEFDSVEDVYLEFAERDNCLAHNVYSCKSCLQTKRIADKTFPTDSEVIIAGYEYENYEGSAFVLFEKNGKLYEVNGGHCSCYGLEGQWTPEETTWEALYMRKYYMTYQPSAFDATVREIVEFNV